MLIADAGLWGIVACILIGILVGSIWVRKRRSTKNHLENASSMHIYEGGHDGQTLNGDISETERGTLMKYKVNVKEVKVGEATPFVNVGHGDKVEAVMVYCQHGFVFEIFSEHGGHRIAVSDTVYSEEDAAREAGNKLISGE